MMNIQPASDLPIPEIQRCLDILGYDLGDERATGKYGDQTATALYSFKLRSHLPEGEVLDQATWVALIDASRVLGERLLYLRMPWFVGNDVQVLQKALSAMGFACDTDWAFDKSTERAVCEFQRNMALPDDGIVDRATCQAIQRLGHIWEGKPGVHYEAQHFSAIRDTRVLEQSAICIFGTEQVTRSIADRVANLTQAITEKTRVISASALEQNPDAAMILVGLQLSNDEVYNNAESSATVWLDDAPLNVFVADQTHPRRITINLNIPGSEQPFDSLREQRLAIRVLDHLCQVFSPAANS